MIYKHQPIILDVSMRSRSPLSTPPQPSTSPRRRERRTSLLPSPSLPPNRIKSQANILIDTNCTARLTDFGLLTISESQNFATSYTSQNEKGSLRWMSPELFESGAKKARSSDVYAFGMTVLEVGIFQGRGERDRLYGFSSGSLR